PDINPNNYPSFCTGINVSSDPSIYVCRDLGFGQMTLATGLPLEGVAGIDSNYHRFACMCPGNLLATYNDRNPRQYVSPPFQDFYLSTTGQPIAQNMTLPVGTFLDCFISEYGTFMSPAGGTICPESASTHESECRPWNSISVQLRGVSGQ
ncbi:hypothetical protein K469DRAFT_812459, partial [Zopfia rhizophila CBS 207.26]